MKFSYVGAAAALAVTAVLAACGGKAQFTVQGTVTNLNNPGLVLVNNGGDELTVPSGATSFAFPKQIPYGTDYNITVLKQPAHMLCGVGGGTGSAGHTVSIQAQVACVQNSYSLGGQFTGLTSTVASDGTVTPRTVTLLNGTTGGSATVSSANGTNGAGDFVFDTPVKDGDAYGVTVVDPNNGLSCTIANGTGVMHETPVTNLLLTCVPK